MTMGSRVLNGIERIGNKLPDPVFLFLWLIGGLIVLSLVGAGLGWSAVNPVTGDTLAAKSLLAPENLERLIIGMPSTLTDFPPLGIVVTIIYGASVAERSGLFTTAIRADPSASNAPPARRNIRRYSISTRSCSAVSATGRRVRSLVAGRKLRSVANTTRPAGSTKPR